MLLYFMRHALAEMGATGDDFLRGLSPEGRQSVQWLLPLLRSLRVQPEWIISSPYRRAVETARLVAEGLGYQRDIISDAALSPAGSVIGVQALLVAFSQCDQLLLVGHAPSMPTWIGELCGAPGFRFEFPAGAICCIKVPDPRQWRGTLCWLVSEGGR